MGHILAFRKTECCEVFFLLLLLLSRFGHIALTKYEDDTVNLVAYNSKHAVWKTVFFSIIFYHHVFTLEINLLDKTVIRPLVVSHILWSKT